MATASLNSAQGGTGWLLVLITGLGPWWPMKCCYLCRFFYRVGAVTASSPTGVLLPPVWSARSQQASEAGPASAGDLPVQWPPSGKSHFLPSSFSSPPPLSSPPCLDTSLSHIIPGNQDFPEEEELGDVQLQTVLLSVWDASHAVWKSV